MFYVAYKNSSSYKSSRENFSWKAKKKIFKNLNFIFKKGS